MVNIPTDLLRTLIAVIDLRSFTRAAQSLGVTQPAVSAQIKRLQLMLGADLFDKTAPGVTLTARGETMVNYARRILALNDQMLEATAHGGPAARLRIGADDRLFRGAGACARSPNSARRIRSCIARSTRSIPRRCCATCAAATTISCSRRPTASRPTARAGAGSSRPRGARHRRRSSRPTGRCALVVVGESSLSRRLSVAALEAGRDRLRDRVCGRQLRRADPGRRGGHRRRLLGAAPAAGRGLQVLDNAPRLPKVPDVVGGVYLREGADSPQLIELADRIAGFGRRRALDRGR